ncbi:hypothetical protein HZA75_03490 [Candidatus Roizmanbacteria bacterium]|nr:hypothetical protein [Candidatus Roizmanbacteria bacterium]
MKKILFSLFVIFIFIGLISGVTSAYFSDTVTSTGNTFTTGTLDLNLDGNNTNVVKFAVTDIKPGDSETRTWEVNNVGNMNGYLDLHNLIQTHDPGISTEQELTVENPDIGTLGNLLNIDLFVDANNNGVFDSGDTAVYSGAMDGLSTDYDLNLPLNANTSSYLTMTISWPSSANDNAGQGDIAQLDMLFELGQTTAQ